VTEDDLRRGDGIVYLIKFDVVLLMDLLIVSRVSFRSAICCCRKNMTHSTTTVTQSPTVILGDSVDGSNKQEAGHKLNSNPGHINADSLLHSHGVGLPESSAPFARQLFRL
jgi:hypothetical protein